MDATLLVPYSLGLLAGVLLIAYLDRLRVMNFASHRWSVVGMHLAWALWLGRVAFDALLAADADVYQAFALLGALLWLVTSRPTWRHGPPEHTASSPAPLDALPTQPTDAGHDLAHTTAAAHGLRGKHH